MRAPLPARHAGAIRSLRGRLPRSDPRALSVGTVASCLSTSSIDLWTRNAEEAAGFSSPSI